MTIEVLTCKRCSHSWARRKKKGEVKFCPHCKSSYWNQEYKRKTVMKAVA